MIILVSVFRVFIAEQLSSSTLSEYDTIVRSANVNRNGDMRKAEERDREKGDVYLNVDES